VPKTIQGPENSCASVSNLIQGSKERCHLQDGKSRLSPGAFYEI